MGIVIELVSAAVEGVLTALNDHLGPRRKRRRPARRRWWRR